MTSKNKIMTAILWASVIIANGIVTGNKTMFMILVVSASMNILLPTRDKASKVCAKN